MPRMTRREVARRVRDLLNNNGLHWTKGEYVLWGWNPKMQEEVQTFCMMGGIQHVLYGDGEYVPETPSPGEPEFDAYAETLVELARIIRRRYPERVRGVNGPGYQMSQPLHVQHANIVVAFNDHDQTTWADVNSVLGELALEKAKKAAPPVTT